MSDFTSTFTVKQTPDQVFEAINNVRDWWTGDITGETKKLGDEFTYTVKDIHYSKQKVVQLVPGKKVVWKVLEAQLNFVKDKAEWVNSEIIFEISKDVSGTKVKFTHVGLNPKQECYGACVDAWSYYINDSLRTYIQGK